MIRMILKFGLLLVLLWCARWALGWPDRVADRRSDERQRQADAEIVRWQQRIDADAQRMKDEIRAMVDDGRK